VVSIQSFLLEAQNGIVLCVGVGFGCWVLEGFDPSSWCAKIALTACLLAFFGGGHTFG
jgi:hypothetical protein